MSQTDITPALTLHQWQEIMYYGVDGATNDGTTTADDRHYAMAIANAALPDDDPRKITRGDVDAVDEATTFLPEQMHDLVAILRATVAKLAALLPPE
jgi:hypothetical protein